MIYTPAQHLLPGQRVTHDGRTWTVVAATPTVHRGPGGSRTVAVDIILDAAGDTLELTLGAAAKVELASTEVIRYADSNIVHGLPFFEALTLAVKAANTGEGWLDQITRSVLSEAIEHGWAIPTDGGHAWTALGTAAHTAARRTAK